MATFLTKKHLSRRHFLRGTGVALALPFLDAMVPAATALAQTAAAPKTRAGFFYIRMAPSRTTHRSARKSTPGPPAAKVRTSSSGTPYRH